MKSAKKRLNSDITGEKGVTKIRCFCDDYNFLFQGEPRKDYGIDCYIEIVLENRPTNFLIGVQSKSGTSYKKGETDKGFYIYFSDADISYWLASNIPVFVSFYDENEKKLYFKHVQFYCSQIQLPINQVDRIHFDKILDIAEEKMAEYIRKLVSATPTEINRLNIISCKNPQVCVPNVGMHLERGQLDESFKTSINIYDYFQPIGNDYLYNFKIESFILGYSKDLDWVARISVKKLGNKCNVVGITFINLKRWSSLYLPIFEEADEEAEGINEVEMKRRLQKVQELINKLMIRPAFQILKEYRYFDNEQHKIYFNFSDEIFYVSISQMNNRAALILTSNKFIPPRKAMLSIERKMTSRIVLSDDDMIEFERPKGFKSIAEISMDESATMIAFGILTNEEHGCWGNPEVQHVYYTIDEIRSSCIQALQG
ncbi:DUF4365 domain-containing protein [Desnuesiella massiliensis]|uniref:DUF4365 domain-containing protein n=1 Tax=Desnuesiella massiliensis TaxID=1650662 RepID=UPI0006E3150C|nr:DUF4365 domain-containing protein [Desnuesiella massiliensis]